MRFWGRVAPITAIAPRCISAAPSPSRHQTRRDCFCRAMPRAMEELWPMEPTVRKSWSWPSPRPSRSSKTSRLALPVVEMTKSSPAAVRMRPMASSRDMGKGLA